MHNYFDSGASSTVEATTANLASLKLGIRNHDGAPQVVKLLDENLQWNDSALEVHLSSLATITLKPRFHMILIVCD